SINIHCNNVNIKKKKVELVPQIVAKVRKGEVQDNGNFFTNFKKAIKKRIAPEIIQLFRRKSMLEIKERKLPRFVATSRVLLGKNIRIPDEASYHFMFSEIFENEIYKFKTLDSNPFIIDAGA